VYSVVLCVCVCVCICDIMHKSTVCIFETASVLLFCSLTVYGGGTPRDKAFFFASNIKFSKNYFLSRNEGAVCSRGMNTSLRCLLVPPSEIVFLSRHFLNRVIYVNSITQYIIEVAFLFFLSMGNDKISICFFLNVYEQFMSGDEKKLCDDLFIYGVSLTLVTKRTMWQEANTNDKITNYHVLILH